MKRVLVIMVFLSLCANVFAQRKGGYYPHYHSRVVVVPTVRYGVDFGFGYPFYPYSAFGYPYGFPYYGYPYPYSYTRLPSELELQIQSVKQEYNGRIKAVRHDKSLSRADRKKEIQDLKSQREQAVTQAHLDYLKRRNGRMNRKYNSNDHTQAM